MNEIWGILCILINRLPGPKKLAAKMRVSDRFMVMVRLGRGKGEEIRSYDGPTLGLVACTPKTLHIDPRPQPTLLDSPRLGKSPPTPLPQAPTRDRQGGLRPIGVQNLGVMRPEADEYCIRFAAAALGVVYILAYACLSWINVKSEVAT